MIHINYKIPLNCVKFLKRPLGNLYVGNGKYVITKIKKQLLNKIIIAIGDVTTNNLLSASVFPNICVIDGFTKRTKFDINFLFKLKYYKFYWVKNDPGFLSLNSIFMIEKILKQNTNSCIIVDGEEDLFTILAILFSDFDSIVLYGQPKKGLVFVKSSIILKKKMYKLVK